MSNFPQGSPLKNSYAQQPAGITDESNKEELSYMGQEQNQNHHRQQAEQPQQPPLSVGISPEQHPLHPDDAEEERQRLILSEDMDSNGFPNSWPKVSPPPFLPVTVAPPTVEPPSPEKDFSPPTVTRNIESPPLRPPPPPSKCCIIL
ncbi:hypothetical protein ES319_A10G226400v1 [Gossypium barbadense]|uniref:Uncharacterized protein n=1 Tax=Gossypium barbadense TaxID=3634 RepID=A0A5J5UAS9_GOSBA|nr:hypothetical protein ES319_A10G226400v1 [Gossypium barbadense]